MSSTLHAHQYCVGALCMVMLCHRMHSIQCIVCVCDRTWAWNKYTAPSLELEEIVHECILCYNLCMHVVTCCTFWRERHFHRKRFNGRNSLIRIQRSKQNSENFFSVRFLLSTVSSSIFSLLFSHSPSTVAVRRPDKHSVFFILYFCCHKCLI